MPLAPFPCPILALRSAFWGHPVNRHRTGLLGFSLYICPPHRVAMCVIRMPDSRTRLTAGVRGFGSRSAYQRAAGFSPCWLGPSSVGLRVLRLTSALSHFGFTRLLGSKVGWSIGRLHPIWGTKRGHLILFSGALRLPLGAFSVTSDSAFGAFGLPKHHLHTLCNSRGGGGSFGRREGIRLHLFAPPVAPGDGHSRNYGVHLGTLPLRVSTLTSFCTQ